jgi:hypothetical protein
MMRVIAIRIERARDRIDVAEFPEDRSGIGRVFLAEFVEDRFGIGRVFFS